MPSDDTPRLRRLTILFSGNHHTMTVPATDEERLTAFLRGVLDWRHRKYQHGEAGEGKPVESVVDIGGFHFVTFDLIGFYFTDPEPPRMTYEEYLEAHREATQRAIDTVREIHQDGDEWKEGA